MKTTRNLWPLGVVAAFVIFIAGTAGLVVMACSNKSDLVSANYYEDEIRFQKQIDRTARARELSSKATVSYDSASRQIIVALPGEHGQSATHGSIHLYRPSEAGLDRHIELQLNSAGTQTIDAARLKPGLWKMKITWTAGGVEYFVDQKVVVGEKKSR